VVRKNPVRERLLLDYWMRGETVRNTARGANIPEGTVSGYFARFNRDPEKYHRQATSDQSSTTDNPYDDLPSQLLTVFNTERVNDRHKRLMDEGKFAEAKLALEAEMLCDRYMSTKRNGLTSFAFYFAYPDRYAFLLPSILSDLLELNIRRGKSARETLDVFEDQIKAAPSTLGSKDNILTLIQQLRAKYQRSLDQMQKRKKKTQAFRKAHDIHPPPPPLGALKKAGDIYPRPQT
jgi:hypothetical protein